uniref:Uncharacterized protein n=1 Tax=Panagrolaimus sp. JU765 TaxID=591449 RepID=A0AC34QD57_9BILA
MRRRYGKSSMMEPMQEESDDEDELFNVLRMMNSDWKKEEEVPWDENENAVPVEEQIAVPVDEPIAVPVEFICRYGKNFMVYHHQQLFLVKFANTSKMKDQFYVTNDFENDDNADFGDHNFESDFMDQLIKKSRIIQ